MVSAAVSSETVFQCLHNVGIISPVLFDIRNAKLREFMHLGVTEPRVPYLNICPQI